MDKSDAVSQLKEAILIKEMELTTTRANLKKEIHMAYEKLQPSNILQAGLKEIAESAHVKAVVMDASIGLVAGYLSKALIVRGSGNPLLKILGSAIQFTVSALVSKNPTIVRSVGDYVFKNVTPKREAGSEKAA